MTLEMSPAIRAIISELRMAKVASQNILALRIGSQYIDQDGALSAEPVATQWGHKEKMRLRLKKIKNK